MASGQTYLNIHTTQFPGGEISGFLEATAPEPSTLLLAGAALASLTLFRRRQPTPHPSRDREGRRYFPARVSTELSGIPVISSHNTG